MSLEIVNHAVRVLQHKSLYAREENGILYVLTREKTEVLYELARVGISRKDVI